jgi:hypothetical protein
MEDNRLACSQGYGAGSQRVARRCPSRKKAVKHGHKQAEWLRGRVQSPTDKAYVLRLTTV